MGTEPDAPAVRRDPIICSDGYWVSVQASKWHFCTPENNTGPWTHVEVYFPWHLDEDDLKDMPYGKDSVYACVPVDVLQTVLRRHGGDLLVNNGAADLAELKATVIK